MSERRSYHVGNLRTRLQTQAREMLEETGLAGLNLRALAARTGITAGSMYHHYDSKAALLGELAAHGFVELRRELERADREAADGGRLRAWATAYFAFAQRQPALFGLMFDPAISAGAGVQTARETVVGTLRTLVDAIAGQQGRAEEPRESIAQAVWAAAHGAATLALSHSGGDELMADVIRGLEALFRPPPAGGGA